MAGFAAFLFCCQPTRTKAGGAAMTAAVPRSVTTEPFTDDFCLESRGPRKLHRMPHSGPEPEPESDAVQRKPATAHWESLVARKGAHDHCTPSRVGHGGGGRDLVQQQVSSRRKQAGCCGRIRQQERLHIQQGHSASSSVPDCVKAEGTPSLPGLEPAFVPPGRAPASPPASPSTYDPTRPWLSDLSPVERQTLDEMREEGKALLQTAHEKDPLLRPDGEVRGVDMPR